MSKLLNTLKLGLSAVINNGKSFDRIAKPVELIAATEGGNLKFQWTVQEDQINGFGTLHGGYTAYMVDLSTSVAIMSLGKNVPGVSIELNISFLKAAKVGEVVTMETDVKKIGSNLAFAEAILRNSKGDLLATGRHTKFIGETRTQTKSIDETRTNQ